MQGIRGSRLFAAAAAMALGGASLATANEAKLGSGTPVWWHSGAQFQMDPPLRNAWWIWTQKDMLAAPDRSDAIVFYKALELPAAPKGATLRISAQGTYRLSINGTEVGCDSDAVTLDLYEIGPYLRKGSNTLQVWVKSDQWYAGLFACGTVALPRGREVAFQTDKTWQWSRPGEKPVAPAGEVSQGVNGGFWNNVGRLMVMPHAWYRLNTELDEPGLDWAKPYAGKAPKVLAIHPRAAQRDTVQLALHTDLPVSAVFSDVYNFNVEHSTAPFFPVTKGMGPDDIKAELRNAFAGRPDVVILGSMGSYKGEEVFYSTLAEPLKALVAGGGGLVYASGAIPGRTVPAAEPGKKPTQDRSYEEELTAAPLKQTPTFLASGVPYQALPGFSRGGKVKDLEKVATLFTYGKGRIVRLSGGICGGYGLFANVLSDDNGLHYQYYLSFAIKAILWAAGNEPTVAFGTFPQELSATRGDAKARLAFSLSGVPRDCRVTLEVRCPKKLYPLPAVPLTDQGVDRGAPILRPLYTAERKVARSAGTDVAFDIPALPAGSYFVDVTVYRGRKKVNWATAHLTVSSPLDIAEVKASKEHIDVADGKADRIGTTVKLTAAAPAGTSVCFGLFDNYDRLLATRDVPVPAGQDAASVEFPVTEFATCLGKIRAELRQGDDVAAFETVPFTAIRRDWDRFTFFGWTGAPGGHQESVYLRVLAGLGLDASQYAQIDLKWLEAADRVALPAYPFPALSADITDPQKMMDDYSAQSRKIVQSQLRYDPIAFSKGNEFFYGGGDEQPARIAGFRAFLKQKYGEVAALNKAWGSAYGTFDAVYPVSSKSAEELKKLGGDFIPQARFLEEADSTRNYGRVVDQWLSNYEVYMDLARVSLKGIKESYPAGRVGMDCPMWPHATSGHDWYTFMQEFGFFAPYGRGGEVIPEREARSYKHDGQFTGLEYGGYLYMAFNRKEELTDTAWQRWRIWNGLFQGFSSVWWYTLAVGGNESNIGPGFEPYPTLKAATDEIARIRSGYYSLLNPLKRDYGPIAVHDSVLSRITSLFLPQDFASRDNYGHNMDAHVLMHLVETVCGHGYTLVSDPQIAAGELSKYKVLVMPLSCAVAATQAKALRDFVQDGGVLLADVRPGVFDGSGRWDENQTIPSLFGLSFKKELGRNMLTGNIKGALLGREINVKAAQAFPADPAVVLKGAEPVCSISGVPLVTVNAIGNGKAICLNIPFTYYKGRTMPDSLYAYWGDRGHNELAAALLNAIFDALGVQRVLKLDTPAGERWPFGLDTAYFQDGAAQYVGITKRRESDEEPARRITVHVPKAGYVYDSFSGRCLGRRDSWKTDVRQVEVQLFSVLPYRVTGLAVELASGVSAPGGQLDGTLEVRNGAAAPAVRHVVHLEVVRPDGKSVRYLARSLEADAGKAVFRLPFALNEPAGNWTLKLTDVATQTTKTVRFALAAPR